MSQGVLKVQYKRGTAYRAGITYKNKHISLGSYDKENDAYAAYLEASNILKSNDINIDNFNKVLFTLKKDKVVTLINFRDKGMYIANPIYLRNNYFSYFLDDQTELKFDFDDLFYYSSHKIIKRGGHLYVNDYGSQLSLVSRYGVHPFAKSGIDYKFSNDDPTDFRYSNIIVINRYIGVHKTESATSDLYVTKIHINGNYTIGKYKSDVEAAVAYNKAIDLAKANGINKNFTENIILDIDAKTYADIYMKIKISKKYIDYLKEPH